MKDGLYPEMTREQYDTLTERENWSRLKSMEQSPAHYRHALLEPRADTSALRNGRANHTAVFEPEKFASQVSVWKGERRAGKVWEAFRDANEDKDILTSSEYEQLVGMQRAVRQHPVAGKYLRGGKPEVSVLWTYEMPAIGGLGALSIKCKSRLDYVAPECLLDLKTCRNASPRKFGSAAWDFRYHAQAAFYVDAVAAVTGRRLPYVIIAAELAPPCVVQVYVLPEYVIEAGRQMYRALLSRLDECRQTDTWDGYSSDEMELQLPSWSGVEVPDVEGEGLDELGLSIGGM